jgi:hypothetical protein
MKQKVQDDLNKAEKTRKEAEELKQEAEEMKKKAQKEVLMLEFETRTLFVLTCLCVCLAQRSTGNESKSGYVSPSN